MYTVCFCPPDFEAHWSKFLNAKRAWLARLRRLHRPGLRLRLRRYFLRLQDLLPGTFHCSVCMEDRDTNTGVRFATCQHPFCQDCARGYVSSKLEGQELPILCPLCVTQTERSANQIGGESHSALIMNKHSNRVISDSS